MSAHDVACKLATILKAEGYSISDINSGIGGSTSFWLFRPFGAGERGSKTYTAKKLAVIRVEPDGAIRIEKEWESGTRKILTSLGITVGAAITPSDRGSWASGEKAAPRPRRTADYQRNVSSSYGAPMGRASDLSSSTTKKLRVERVPLRGDYDQGGAYWGSNSPGSILFAVTDEDDNVKYIRARDREDAKAKFPNAKFHR